MVRQRLGFALAMVGILLISACQGRIHKPEAATVQGCVMQSDGGYVLSTDAGRKYVLTGDSRQLQSEAGHEAILHGNLVDSKEAPQAPSQAQNGAESQLSITSIKHVSDKCTKPQ